MWKGIQVVILSLSVLSVCSSTERVSVERQIKEELRDIMRTEDLENITSKQVPQREMEYNIHNTLHEVSPILVKVTGERNSCHKWLRCNRSGSRSLDRIDHNSSGNIQGVYGL